MGVFEREQEKALFEVKEFLVSVIANSPYGIIAFDLEGEIIMINALAIKYLGKRISVNNAMGKNILNLTKHIPILNKAINTAKTEGGKPFDLPPVQIKNKFILIKGRLISTGIILVFEDITSQKKAEVELFEANIKLQESDRLKSVFLANMSHELRTPLNTIIGFTGMILMGIAGDLNAEQKKQLTMVKNSGHHLLSLINDILDISKIESGKTEIFPDEFYINDVIQEVIDMIAPLVNNKEIELSKDIPKKTLIFSDRKRVKQILMNLVSNAIKFTEKGNVKIKTRILKNGHFEVCVIDTGIGIKKKNISKLFGFFQQVDMSSTKKYEGTGLGLYLSKKLVTLLGGNITVKSKYGKGSKFTVNLPIKYVETK